MRFKVPVPCKGHEKIAGYKHCDGQYDTGVAGDKRHMSFPLGGMPIEVQAFRILYHFCICLVIQGEELEYPLLPHLLFFILCNSNNHNLVILHFLS